MKKLKLILEVSYNKSRVLGGNFLLQPEIKKEYTGENHNQ